MLNNGSANVIAQLFNQYWSSPHWTRTSTSTSNEITISISLKCVSLIFALIIASISDTITALVSAITSLPSDMIYHRGFLIFALITASIYATIMAMISINILPPPTVIMSDLAAITIVLQLLLLSWLPSLLHLRLRLLPFWRKWHCGIYWLYPPLLPYLWGRCLQRCMETWFVEGWEGRSSLCLFPKVLSAMRVWAASVPIVWMCGAYSWRPAK